MKNIWIEKKKNIVIMLFFFITMMVVSGFTSMAVRAEGNTWNTSPEDGVYRISTVDDLIAFREMINTEYTTTTNYQPFIGKTVVLENDIDIGSTSLICTKNIKNCGFSGTFDGMGHTIKGFNDTTYGLFGSIGEAGTVKNLNIVANVNTDAAGLQYGVYAYRNQGLISSCSVAGDINTTGATSSVGGLVYELLGKGRIENCYSRVKISLKTTVTTTNASGLICNNNGAFNSVNNCYVISEKIEAGMNIFAVAPAGKDSVVTNCYYYVANNPTFNQYNKGTYKTSDDLKQQATYTNWDFYNVWKFNASENDGYPTLQFGSVKTRDDVIGFINSLKETKDLSLGDQYTIQYIRKAFSSLSEQDQKSVSNSSKLTEAENRISVLINAKSKADQVTALINAIPADNEITLEYRSQIETARSELNSITDADVLNFISEDTKNKLSAAEAKLNAITSNSNTWESSNKTIISTAEDLNAFRSSISNINTYSGVTIVLNNDLTINDTQAWASLNTLGSFKGTFDGKGHTIKGFNDAKNGLFYLIDATGQVLNLNIEFNILGAVTSIGGITYNLAGTIESCSITGSIKGSSNLGGLAYMVSTTGVAKNCSSSVDVISTGSSVKVSGLAVTVSGDIKNSYSRGNITCTGNNIYAVGRGPNPNTKGIGNTSYYLDTIKTNAGSIFEVRNVGTAKSAADMKNKDTYTGWDFDTVWQIDPAVNNGFPTLRQGKEATAKQTVQLKAIIHVEDKVVPAEGTASLTSPPSDRMKYLEPTFTVSLVPIDSQFDASIISTYHVSLVKSNPDTYTAVNVFTGQEVKNMVLDVVKISVMINSSKMKLVSDANDLYNFEVFNATSGNLLAYEANTPSFAFNGDTTPPTAEEKAQILATTEAAITSQLAEKLPADTKPTILDSWLFFTAARAGYKSYDGLYDDCYKLYEAKYQNATSYTGDDVAKDVLAITAMGYDPRNVAGKNLVDIMQHSGGTSWFTAQVVNFAINSYDYSPGSDTAYIHELAAKAVENSGGDNGTGSPDGGIDMYVMYFQPIAAYYNPNATKDDEFYDVKVAMETVFFPYFSKMQGYTGTFYSGIVYGNPWSTAQADIMLGMSKTDIFASQYIKNGNTLLSDLNGNTGFSSDVSQCARGYEAMVRAAKGENQLFDCTDVLNSTVRVNNAIAALPTGDVTGENVNAAKTALSQVDDLIKNLGDYQKSTIDMTQYNTLKAKVDGISAHDMVIAQITALPEAAVITLDNQQAVTDARGAYDVLTSEEKALVSNVQKLTDCEARLAALQAAADTEAAKAVAEQINTLGVIKNYSQHEAVEAARNAYDKLTTTQKTLVSADTLKILTDAETAIAALKPAYGTITIDVERFTIGQGFYVDPVTVDITEGETARQAVEKLLGAENLIGDPGYLRAVIGADTGKATIPDYIVDKLGGANTETANSYVNADGKGYTGNILGEFDYSKYSGWMYFVNNETPNVGMNSYTLKDGDVMRLAFTYWGTGSDLTGIEYGSNKVLVDIADKDSLIKALAAVNTQDKAGYLADAAIKTAYDNGMAVVQNMTATKKATKDAADALNKAMDAHKAADAAAVKTVEKQIKELPAVDKLALADKTAVAAARSAYNALTATQQAQVSNLATLAAAEARIAALEPAPTPTPTPTPEPGTAKDDATGVEVIGLPTGTGIRVVGENSDQQKNEEAQKAADAAGITNAKVVSLYDIKPDISADELAKFNADPTTYVTINLPLDSSQLGYDSYVVYHKTEAGTVEWITPTLSADGKTLTFKVNAFSEFGVVGEKTAAKTVNCSYQTQIENIGWQDVKTNGETSGTSQQSLRLEGIKISLDNAGYDLGVSYQTHVQDLGWQGFKADGTLSGTENQAKRLEAIQIKLTGADADKFDIYYRVHAQNYGWLGWAKDGASAGTEGLSLRLEAIEIRVVEKGAAAPGNTDQSFVTGNIKCSYQTQIENIGWQDVKTNGDLSGTTGQSLRLEGIKINLDNAGYDVGLSYQTHVQDLGWQDLKTTGVMSGTEGQSKRLEAIRISLTGADAGLCDIYYQVHAENIGWMGWAKNGESAGTEGLAYRLEGIRIMVVPKGAAAPGSTETPFVSNNQ